MKMLFCSGTDSFPRGRLRRPAAATVSSFCPERAEGERRTGFYRDVREGCDALVRFAPEAYLPHPARAAKYRAQFAVCRELYTVNKPLMQKRTPAADRQAASPAFFAAVSSPRLKETAQPRAALAR